MATALTTPANTDVALTSAVIESLVLRGDISGLSPADKTKYYTQLCERVGLDPATTPFKPLKLNGKELLYADKGAAEQLRNKHKISIAIAARDQVGDVYYVTARATMPDGRTDESQGAVAIGSLKGDNLANAIMKAETKAKRRVTLSIVGLGMLDESELETIDAARFQSIPKEGAQQQQAPAPTNVRQLEAPKDKAKPKAEAKANSNPPKKWTPNDPIPEVIMRGMPKPVQALKDIPLSRLAVDDLELLVEQGKAAYTRWAGISSTPEKLKQLMQAIIAEAEIRLRGFGGDAPPPPDDGAPKDADVQPKPLDYDPVTGEVHGG